MFHFSLLPWIFLAPLFVECCPANAWSSQVLSWNWEAQPSIPCQALPSETDCRQNNLCCFQANQCFPANPRFVECVFLTTFAQCSESGNNCMWEKETCRRACPFTNNANLLCGVLGRLFLMRTSAPSFPTSNSPSLFPTKPIVWPSNTPTHAPSYVIVNTASPSTRTLTPSKPPSSGSSTSTPSFTARPTMMTSFPVSVQSHGPTLQPQMTSSLPSLLPSSFPTSFPSMPSFTPTRLPTSQFPSRLPTVQSKYPSALPTSQFPSQLPTVPSVAPSLLPTSRFPSRLPTSRAPSVLPTNTQSRAPSVLPTSTFPSTLPTSLTPSMLPTSTFPSQLPTSSFPSHFPTVVESVHPSLLPTSKVPTTESMRPSPLPTSLFPTTTESTQPSLLPTTTASPFPERMSASPFSLNPTLVPTTGTFPPTRFPTTNSKSPTQPQQGTRFPTTSQHSTPASFVILLVDDMGFGDLEYSVDLNSLPRRNLARTPHLNAMASSSNTWVLNNMHSEAACSPSRASIMTGRSPLRDCVWGEPIPNKVIHKTNTTTVLHLASQLGYETLFLGKWIGHPNPQEPSEWPTRLGFKDWWILNGGATYDYACGCRDSTAKTVSKACFLGHEQENAEAFEYATTCTAISSPHGDVTFPPRFKMDADQLADQFQAWLKQKPVDRPYVAQISFRSVHNPFVASPELREACFNGTACQQRAKLQSVELDYGGVVFSVDRAVGAIRRAVRLHPQGANTVMIFISDNGPAPPPVGAGSNGGLRGNKGKLFEGLLRVPSLIEWPRVIHSNRVSNSLLSILDIPATIAHVISGKQYSELGGQDGMSIFPYLMKNQVVFDRTGYLGVCSFIDENEMQQKITCDELAYFHPQGRWKVIATRKNPKDSKAMPNGVGQALLYDLHSEKGEFVAVMDNPEVLNEIVGRANKWLDDVFGSFRDSCKGYY